ncbi:hypothetical protein AAHE18_12G067700 [Arachis hypogaea]
MSSSSLYSTAPDSVATSQILLFSESCSSKDISPLSLTSSSLSSSTSSSSSLCPASNIGKFLAVSAFVPRPDFFHSWSSSPLSAPTSLLPFLALSATPAALSRSLSPLP